MAQKQQRIAIAYDFDGTLAPGNMQQHSFIPTLGVEIKTFWHEVKELAKNHNMNEILAYMHLMLKKAKEKDISITKDAFQEYGSKIPLFPGVKDYFYNINNYAKTKNLKIEHYIISSGLEDILKGTSIYRQFEVVFASAYKYDANKVAEWPALAIDYTSKTQFLYRINKGIKNAWDNESINKYTPELERPIPFERMIYIGDGETDIPAMKMATQQGGKSIAVYNPDLKTKAAKKVRETTLELVSQGRADYVAAADYSEGSNLYQIITLCIDSIATEIELQKFKNKQNRKPKSTSTSVSIVDGSQLGKDGLDASMDSQ